MKISWIILSAVVFSLSNWASLDVGIRSRSVGGAIRAEGSSNDVIFYNPAALTKTKAVRLELDYLKSGMARHSLGASISDSSTAPWALGLAYNSQFSSKQSAEHLLYLALAMPLGTDMLSLGGSVSYVYNPQINNQLYSHFFNLDVGVLANLPMGLSLALALDHLLKNKGHEKPLGLAIGSAFDFAKTNPLLPLIVSFDWLMDDVKSELDLQHQFGAGMQMFLFEVLALRIGFNHKQKNNELISLGGGFTTSKLQIDGLYQQDVLVGMYRHFGVALRFAM